MLSAPTSTAPAASSRSTSVASRDAGGRSRLIFDPARVASPFTSNRFFTANGTPASAPGFVPAAIAASTARAFDRARSAVTLVKEFSTPSYLTIRASAASVASSADNFLSLTARAMSSADITADAVSGCEDTGGLGFVGKFKLVHHPREAHGHFEIGPDRRLPGVLDRQSQEFRGSVDIVVQGVFSHCCRNLPLADWQRWVGIAVSNSLV